MEKITIGYRVTTIRL